MRTLLIIGLLSISNAWATAPWLELIPNADWTPPAGCPRPTFGITNSHWMYHSDLNPSVTYAFTDGRGTIAYPTNEFGPYTHYVSTSGTDSGRPYGTPAAPRATIPYPVAAGSVIQVAPGTYTSANISSFMAFGGTGTENAPIFYTPATSDTNLIPALARTGQAIVWWGNWTIVQGFRTTNNATTSTRPLNKAAPVTQMWLRWVFARGDGTTSGSSFAGTGGSSLSSALYPTTYYGFLKCNIADFGDWDAGTENDRCGIIAAQHASYVYIYDNEIFRCGGDSIRIGADQGDTPSGGFYFIGRNHFYDNNENGIDVKQAEDAVISENVIHGFPGSISDPAGSAIVVHYDPNNIWYLNNLIYDAGTAIYSTGVDGDTNFYIGNVIYGMRDAGLYPDRGGGTFFIWNNTIVGCPEGIFTDGTIDAVFAANNIIYDSTDYLTILNSTAVAASTVSNELYYEPGGGAISIDVDGSYSSISAWIAATTFGDNSIQSDPLFVNAGANDYSLQSSSPARDAGISLASLNAELRNWAGDVTLLYDRAGNLRGEDGTFDMGAFEYVPAFTPKATAGGTFKAGGNSKF